MRAARWILAGCAVALSLHALLHRRVEAPAQEVVVAKPTRPPDDGCPTTVRVALCFYGLNRALRHTHESIRRHLVAPLRAACARVDVFYHTWSLETLEDTGKAGGEREAVRIGGAAEMRALLGDLVAKAAVTDQAAFDAASNASYYKSLDRRYGGPNFVNLMRQLESLRRVTALWRSMGAHAETHYAAVIYARPDLLFLDDLNATQALTLRENDFLTPYWHQWSGLNDRVAIGRPRAAAAFGNRIELAAGYALETFLRSESFLKWAVCDHHGFDLAFLEARAQRVRASGDVADNDACLKYCSLSLRRTCRADCRKLAPPGEAPPLAAWAKKQQARDREKRRDKRPPKHAHHNRLP